jgi:Poxvirus Late Transcription Factor VLTF3 like
MNNQKKQNQKQVNTLDEKHNELLEHFHDIETKKIPDILSEIQSLKDKIKTLNENQIEQYLDIRDKILAFRSDLKSLKNEKKNYLLDNSKYIFQYFEQKQQISSGTVQPQNSCNVVNSFFKIKSTSTEAANPQSEKYLQSKKAYQNYWRNVGNDLPNIQNFIISSDVCEICNIGEMIPQDEEGILICNNQGCGKFITYIVDSSKPTNKEPPNEVSYTAYIRLNHFKEILSQFQAKETTQIPEEVINAIKARIKKERIKDMSLINYDKMRDILRKLGLNKYFEHIQYINSLFGIKPPIMNEELHETLCVLFIEIQKPWAVHCPANRTNFFNYTYTLYQLCVLLDQTQYLPYIPMMKDREKQLEQDMIWKKVCNDLDWEYFPSV